MNWKRPHHLYYGLGLVFLAVILYFFRNEIVFPTIPYFIAFIGMFLVLDDLVYHVIGKSVVSKLLGRRYVLIVSTFPTDKEAKTILTYLVRNKLIACANRFSCRSIYRWKKDIEREEEVYALLKTTHERVEKVKKTLLNRHSYENPQLFIVPIKSGSRNYLSYLNDATQK